MLSDRLDQRRHQPGCLADPIGQRGAVEVDALSAACAAMIRCSSATLSGRVAGSNCMTES